VKANAKITALTLRIDDMEAASKKYNLVITGLKQRQKLERPIHLAALVRDFFREQLGLDAVTFDEAQRDHGDTASTDKEKEIRCLCRFVRAFFYYSSAQGHPGQVSVRSGKGRRPLRKSVRPPRSRRPRVRGHLRGLYRPCQVAQEASGLVCAQEGEDEQEKVGAQIRHTLLQREGVCL
jgi:hypothetical protein